VEVVAGGRGRITGGRPVARRVEGGSRERERPRKRHGERGGDEGR
jgi:hypothetical protein